LFKTCKWTCIHLFIACFRMFPMPECSPSPFLATTTVPVMLNRYHRGKVLLFVYCDFHVWLRSSCARIGAVVDVFSLIFQYERKPRWMVFSCSILDRTFQESSSMKGCTGDSRMILSPQDGPSSGRALCLIFGNNESTNNKTNNP
jgi:hypothetical protein